MAEITKVKKVEEITVRFSGDEFKILMKVLSDNEIAAEKKFPGVYAVWDSLDNACSEHGLKYFSE